MLPKCYLNFISEDKTIRVLGVINGISLMIFRRNFENISVEIMNLRVDCCSCCLEKFCGREAKDEVKKVYTIDGKKIERVNLVKSFQHKYWLEINGR